MLEITVTIRPSDGSEPKKIAWMKIFNRGLTPEALADEARIGTINPGGERYYDAQYNDGRGRTYFADRVRHRRRDTVWDLVRAVLNHSEGTPGILLLMRTPRLKPRCPGCDKQLAVGLTAGAWVHICGREFILTHADAWKLRWVPELGWKPGKWTVGFWRDMENRTRFGIDVLPLEIVWRADGYRP